jgi:hypothetical protein
MPRKKVEVDNNENGKVEKKKPTKEKQERKNVLMDPIKNWKWRDCYTLHVVGETETVITGTKPEDPDALRKQQEKRLRDLLFDVLKEECRLYLQKGAGGVAEAYEALEAFQTKIQNDPDYSAPLCVFQRDEFNGHRPFIGAYFLLGAMKSASDFMFDCFYKPNRQGYASMPSAKHFRKAVVVRPHHIFFETLDGESVTKVNYTKVDPPTIGDKGEVKSFTNHEYLSPPLRFRFKVMINPNHLKPLVSILDDRKKVRQMIYQAAVHGIGSGRGAGRGFWRVVSIEESPGCEIWPEG